jgi:hypothetical protein
MDELNDPKKAKDLLGKVFLGIIGLYFAKLILQGMSGGRRSPP